MTYWAGRRWVTTVSAAASDAAAETQQLSYVPVADATANCYLCGVARGQPSTNDGPTCKTP